MKTVRIKLPHNLSYEQIAFLSNTFGEKAVASSAIRENHHKNSIWAIEWIIESPPALQDITNILTEYAKLQNIDIRIISNEMWEIQDIPQKNWLTETYRVLPPFSVGPFFIHSGHYSEEIPKDQTPLQIEAVTAFGSGNHGTTRGCLEAMIDLKSMGVCPWNILDMGTGSGILAIAAWRLWNTPILAIDIEEESIHVAKKHCALNDIKISKSTVFFAQCDGFNGKIVDQQKPYELIIANILATPLIEMAEDLVKTCDDNGYIILSGMLHHQTKEILAIYEQQGVKEHSRYKHEDWTTLILKH